MGKHTSRENKVNAIKQQIEAGLHPMQDSNVEVRKKKALSIAEKMIELALEKQNR